MNTSYYDGDSSSIKDPVTSRLAKTDYLGSLRTLPVSRLIGDVFFGTTIDTERWDTSSTINSATVNISSAMLQLSSGTNTAGSAVIRSVPCSYFQSGTTQYFQGFIRLGDTGAASSRRRWGAFDASDGYFFELNGTTFNIVSRKSTVDTTVAKASWNGAPFDFTLDTNINDYQIFWTDYKVYFVINDVLMHTITKTTATLTLTPHLKMSFESTNTGGSTTRLLEIHNPSINRIGNVNSDSLLRYTAAAETRTLKIGAGKLHGLVYGDKGTLSSTLTVYDNTAASGKIILSTDLTQVIPDGCTSRVDVNFYTGLTYVTTGGGIRITILWE